MVTTKMQTIKKRDGREVEFNPSRIQTAIRKAFLANNISDESLFDSLTSDVVRILDAKFSDEENQELPTVEHTQDIVEIVLIQRGFVKIARSYILYREKHKEIRQEKTLQDIKAAKLTVVKGNGQQMVFEPSLIRYRVEKVSFGLPKVSQTELVDDICKTVYNGIPTSEIRTLTINAAKSRFEDHYQYSSLAARLVLDDLYEDVLNARIFDGATLEKAYQDRFAAYVDQGVELDLLTPELKNFDLGKLAQAIDPSRDLLFFFLGVQTIADRYLLRTREKPQRVFELPQWMWMRVAMGLALKEGKKEDWAIAFYNELSNMYVVSSTPTLFNSGTNHPQMSSCYLNTVDDSLTGIFKTYADNAQLSKWAGGIGTDWTPVRATGAKIHGTNGSSMGIIPFVKIFNDVALAVNQGGKRKGAMAAYLEIWHRDIEEFMELKKNTGDERRRAHDIHTACFIPDLFMQRAKQNADWTLFSPDTVPGLHDLYGKKFKERYEHYEKSNVPGAKKVNALELWRKLLTMLYETGHPWVTFKDAINVRNPQDHTGVIHNSNLCTEITLNTSKEETAVCNLASLNLARMITDGRLNEERVSQSVAMAMRMLDNVVDNNYYPTQEAKNANLRHRPVGLGLMGYQDALYQLKIDFDSEDNLSFADKSMELISYYSILSSSQLAQERGAYATFKGSKWDRGLLPYDTLKLLEEERGEKLKVNHESRINWGRVREHIKAHGMRNSNCMAIAPTATIANIAGVVPCVEPIYKNIYMKENLSGNFVIINKHLTDALDERGLWNRNVINEIKLNNGSLVNVKEIPVDIRRRFKEVFEIDAVWVVKAAALRAKWIDQSASTNIFLTTRSGKQISDIYIMAWEYGLKTTYYLRTLGATQVTKTIASQADAVRQITLQKGEVGAAEPQALAVAASGAPQASETVAVAADVTVAACKLNDPDCEACQ